MRAGFIQGALILSLAGFISKLLGALYRIPLARILGGEGMGLYQMAYPIYTSILAVSTAGVPVAISVLVAEKLANSDYYGAKRIFRISLGMLTFTGLIFSYFLFVNAQDLAEHVLREHRAFSAIAAISPAIYFTAIVSAFRGYFQGHQNMLPTALSQVIEQLVRVITVLAGAVLLLPYGLEFAAAGATFGAVTGGMAALTVLILYYFVYFKSKFSKEINQYKSKDKPVYIILRILKIALPLSIGGLVMPLMQTIDAFFVPIRLQHSGLSPARATELFGQLTGMAGSLVNLPTIITSSLAVSLVPAVSEAMAHNNIFLIKKRIMASLRLVLMLCLPAAAGLWLLAIPISQLLYDLPEAGIVLSYLAPSALFLGLYQITAGALQGLNQAYLPVINLTIGLLIKSFLNYELTAVSWLNINGAALATVVAFLVAFILNYLMLKIKLGLRLHILMNLALPLLATGIMVSISKYTYQFFYLSFSNNIATIGAIVVGIFTYFFSLLMLGGLKEEDLGLIPGVGGKIIKILKNLSILR